MAWRGRRLREREERREFWEEGRAYGCGKEKASVADAWRRIWNGERVLGALARILAFNLEIMGIF